MNSGKRWLLILFGLLLTLGSLSGGNVSAEETLQGEWIPVPVERDENWFKRELRHFRTYPHLDMAYRLIEKDQLTPARKELERYLEIDPDDLNVRGAYMVLLYRLRDYPETVRQADTILTRRPGTAMALLYRGLSREFLNDRQGAAEDLQAALQNPRTGREARVFILSWLVENALRNEQYAAAIDHLEQLISLRQAAEDYFRQGLAYEKLQQLEQAQEAFRRSMELAGSGKEKVRGALFLAAAARQRQQGEAAAREALLAALQVEPENGAVLAELAQLSQKDGNPAEAADWQRRAVAAEPTARNREVLANLLLLAGDRTGARKELEQALADPVEPQAKERILLQLGTLYREEGDSARAESAFGRAADLGGSPEALAAYSRVLADRGEFDKAVPPLEEAVRLHPTADGFRELGTLLAQAGRDKEAADHLFRALAIGLPPSLTAQTRLQLGRLHLKLGRYPEARDCLLQALAVAPEKTEIVFALGEVALAAGDYEEAIREFERGLARTDLRSARTGLAVALEKGGQTERAIQTYERLLATAAGEERQDFLVRLGNLLFSAGKPRKAAELFLAAYREGGSGQPRLLLQAGESLVAAGDRKAAVEIFERLRRESRLTPDEHRQVLSSLGQVYLELGEAGKSREVYTEALRQAASPAERGRMHLNLGFAYRQQGDYRLAAEQFRLALAEGDDTGSARQNLALALFSQGEWDAALQEFRAALAQDPGPTNLIYIGRCYQALNKPGLALHHYEEARPLAGALPAEEKRLFLAELGYLYASQGETDKASGAFADSLALGYDPGIALALAGTRRAGGEPAKALRLLADIKMEALPPGQQILYLEETAFALAATGETGQAAETLRAAFDRQGTPTRAHQLGQLYEQDGNLPEAIRTYRLALQEEENPAVRKSLGYALARDGHPQEAAEVLAGVLDRNAADEALSLDLAYLYRRLPDNEQAVAWFRSAIDRRLAASGNPSPEDAGDAELYKLRQEVTALSRRYSLTAYLTYADLPGERAVPPGVTAGELVRSNSGIEFAWLPPNIGFRNDRIFQAVARLVWNLEPRSLRFDKDSFQGAVGIRYKPLREHNLHFGAERLIKIGDAAQNNWLLRGLYSWADGDILRPGEKIWNYSFLYAEADYLTRPPHGWLWFGEVRQGVTFNWGDALLVRPHLFAAVNYWEPRRLDSAFQEGGPGLSLNYLFNADRYHAHRSRGELLLQYKFGEMIGKTSPGADRSYDGLFLTLLLQF